jgi:hypothetical protein
MSQPKLPSAPMCPYCHKPMPEFQRRNDEKGDLQTIQYACACRGTIYYKNVHLGVFQ